MISKVREKEMAISLRRRGYSYRDILSKVSVSKSSLSAWLKDLSLTDEEKRYLRHRKDSNISKGRIKTATALRRLRLEREKILFAEAKEEFNRFISRPLFQVGIALYWAEGSKRNSYFSFSNSDTEMIVFMIVWIETFFGVSRNDIIATLYIHKPYAHENCEEYWRVKTGLTRTNFRKTIYKPTGLLVKKRPNYKGCLRIALGRVKYLKKIKFWQQMLVEHYRLA